MGAVEEIPNGVERPDYQLVNEKEAVDFVREVLFEEVSDSYRDAVREMGSGDTVSGHPSGRIQFDQLDAHFRIPLSDSDCGSPVSASYIDGGIDGGEVNALHQTVDGERCPRTHIAEED